MYHLRFDFLFIFFLFPVLTF